MRESKFTPEALALRAGMKTWATSLRLLLQAAEEQGADPEAICSKALFEYGRSVSANYGEMHGADEFTAKMVAGVTAKAYDITSEYATKEKAILHIHNCPLVEQWKQEGVSGEELKTLCHYSCYGDRGKISRYPALSMEFPKTQAEGDEYCELVFYYKEK